MSKYKITALLLITTVITVTGTTITAYRSQSQGGEKVRPPRKSQRMIEQESQLPIVDYDEPEPRRLVESTSSSSQRQTRNPASAF